MLLPEWQKSIKLTVGCAKYTALQHLLGIPATGMMVYLAAERRDIVPSVAIQSLNSPQFKA